jgi:hypothetical protein
VGDYDAPEWADYAWERWDAEKDALRRGRPVTRMDEAYERGYVDGDD